MSIMSKLQTYFAAGQAGIVLTSVEPEECFRELAEKVRMTQGTEQPWDLFFWDSADGLTDVNGNRMSAGASKEASDLGLLANKPQKMGLHSTLEAVLDTTRERQYREATGCVEQGDDATRILAIRNFDRLLGPTGMQGSVDVALLAIIQKVILEGQSSNIFLLMQTTPEFELPTELMAHCEYVHHDLPSADERSVIISELISEESEVPASPAVITATAGLSRAKTAQYVAETIATYGAVRPVAIFQKKAVHLSRASKLLQWGRGFSAAESDCC